MAQSEAAVYLAESTFDAGALIAWLVAGAEQSATLDTASGDEDLDFLSETPDVSRPVLPLRRGDASPERNAEALDLLERGGPGRLAGLWPQWQADPRLAGLDYPGALLALRAVLELDRPQTQSHGALAELIGRALQSGDVELGTLAAQVATRLGLSELQETVTQCLQRHCLELQPQGRGLFLDALETLGDGRCVRAMEAFLAQCAGQLLDHEAWRARHIVQVIRRGGRR
jgi:hypothetical protein